MQTSQNPDALQRAIALVNQINQKEGELRALKEQLRAELRGGAAPALTHPKKPGRKKKPAAPTVTVAERVRAHVIHNPGVTAVQIMDALGLRRQEQSVRAALKKEKAAQRFVSQDARWYPTATAVQPQTQQNPAGVLPNGASPLLPGEQVDFSGPRPGAVR